MAYDNLTGCEVFFLQGSPSGSNAEDLNQIPSVNLTNNNIAMLGPSDKLKLMMYRYDPTSVLNDDGLAVIQPADNAGAGRWLLLESPVDNGLYPLPGGVINTGNIIGLDVVYKDAATLTVGAGLCMDSLNRTLLSLSAQQDVDFTGAASGWWFLFLCDDGVVRKDSDVNGANLSAYKIRRLRSWYKMSSGNLIRGYYSGNTFIGTSMADCWAAWILVSSLGGTPTKPSYAEFPTSLINEYGIWIKNTGTSPALAFLDDDSNTTELLNGNTTVPWRGSWSGPRFVNSDVYMSGSGTVDVFVRSIKFKER